MKQCYRMKVKFFLGCILSKILSSQYLFHLLAQFKQTKIYKEFHQVQLRLLLLVCATHKTISWNPIFSTMQFCLAIEKNVPCILFEYIEIHSNRTCRWNSFKLAARLQTFAIHNSVVRFWSTIKCRKSWHYLFYQLQRPSNMESPWFHKNMTINQLNGNIN